jgi:Amt family ammonium transporter
MTGAVAGLATITPAAGYVTVLQSALIGIIASSGCYMAVKFKMRKGWDDALDVWGVHGMGGVIGTICLGLFATTEINPNGANGLFSGGGFTLLFKEVVAILIAVVYAYFFTLLILKAINKFTPVKVDPELEKEGLDISFHGEVARNL